MKKGEVRKEKVGYKVHLDAEENMRKSSKPKERQPRFEGESACEYRRGGGSARGRPRVARAVLLVALLSALTLLSQRCEEVDLQGGPSPYSLTAKEEPNSDNLRLDLEASRVVGTPHEPEDGYIAIVFSVRKVKNPPFPQIPLPTLSVENVNRKIPPSRTLSPSGKKSPAAGGGEWVEYVVGYQLPESTRYPVKVFIEIPWGPRGKPVIKAGFTVVVKVNKVIRR